MDDRRHAWVAAHHLVAAGGGGIAFVGGGDVAFEQSADAGQAGGELADDVVGRGRVVGGLGLRGAGHQAELAPPLHLQRTQRRPESSRDEVVHVPDS